MEQVKKNIVSNKELQALFEKVPDDKRNEASLFVDQLSFMIETLDRLKEQIKSNGVIDDFEQGSQRFKRESQSLKSYNTTMKTYNTTMTNFLKLLEPDTSGDSYSSSSDEGESDTVIRDFWNWLKEELQELLTQYKKQNKGDFSGYEFEKFAMKIYNRENRTHINEADLFISDPLEDWQNEYRKYNND